MRARAELALGPVAALARLVVATLGGARRFLVHAAQQQVARFVGLDARKVRASGAIFDVHRAAIARALDTRSYARRRVLRSLAGDANVLLDEVRTVSRLWRWLGHTSSRELPSRSKPRLLERKG